MSASQMPEGLERCPDCGQPRPGGRLGGLCPQCLLLLAGLGEDDHPMDVPSPRRIFGDYEILEEIARGGMGVVYRARQTSLQREVALKMIRGAELADEDAQRRFQREAHAAASLHHPHIVPVYEIGEHELQPFYTMRLVPGGENIADWAARHRNDHRALAAAVALAARAVAHAHARGVLHRDLKPTNVLWDPETGPQVTDFGLAKRLDDPLSSLSRTGEIVGSPSYMAPEQAAGRHSEVTMASDVYGLGALLYELLTGQPPFRAATSLETLQRAQTEAPARPSQQTRNLHRDLETICLKCLEKNPAHRYASALALAEELERYGRGEPIQARPVSALAQLWRWARRNPALAASLAGLLVVLISGLLGISWQWRQAEVARQGERRERNAAQAGLADQLARNGFAAAREGDPSRAALWFAQAAVASDEPVRRSANALRWRSWRESGATPISAFPAGLTAEARLHWHPAQRHLLVQNILPFNASVWELPDGTRWQPERPLTLARWLPGGERLATWHAGELCLLEFPSGRELWRSRAEDVLQLQVSADGRWLGLGGTQPRLCDLASGHVHPLPRVPDRALARGTMPGPSLGELPGLVLLEFSLDGRHVLLSGRGWRGTCAVSAPEKFAAAPVDCLSIDEFGFLQEGATFVALPTLTRLQTIDAATGAVRHAVDITTPGDPRVSYAADRPSPDGRFLARATAPMIEIATGRPLNFPVHGNAIVAQSFGRDGRLLATTSIDDTVRVWQMENGRSQLVGWHQEPTWAAISPDNRLVATGQVSGGLVRVWRLPTEPPKRSIYPEAPAKFQVSRDEQWLLPTSWLDHNARLDRTRVHRLNSLTPGPDLAPGGIILDGEFAPDAAWVVLGVTTSSPAERRAQMERGSNGAGMLQFWDFRRGERMGPTVALPVEPWALAVHPSGRRIGIYGSGRSLYEYDRESGELRELQAPSQVPGLLQALFASCRYSPDGSVLVGTGRAAPARIFRSGSTERLAPHLSELKAWASAFHGSVLGLVSKEGRVEFTDLPAGTRVGSLDDANWLFFAEFDASGEWFMTGGRNRATRVYEWAQRRLLGPAMLHEGEVYEASFVPGSSRVVTAENSFGRACFWEARLGQQVRPPLQIGSVIEHVRVLRDGTLLASTTEKVPAIFAYDAHALLAPPTLPPAEALALAEIEAAAIVQNGSLEPLGAADWLRRWREFRARHPQWPADPPSGP
ncbi:MAG: protein kinase [Verrucomicrobia bacterium]|nr:protein kinase [Verrucomicrobiota bacterium]